MSFYTIVCADARSFGNTNMLRRTARWSYESAHAPGILTHPRKMKCANRILKPRCKQFMLWMPALGTLGTWKLTYIYMAVSAWGVRAVQRSVLLVVDDRLLYGVGALIFPFEVWDLFHRRNFTWHIHLFRCDLLLDCTVDAACSHPRF